MIMLANRSCTDARDERTLGPVPVWVPDTADADAVDGTWVLVDPSSTTVHPRLAAQARAIARLWSTAHGSAVA
ncbi:MAG: hypothetical protein ACYTJ0_08065 [Planctomycetota bacterium]|jgi:hypothetical protein